MIDKIEQKVFFNATRFFAWFVIILGFLGVASGALALMTVVFKGGNPDVSLKEVKAYVNDSGPSARENASKQSFDGRSEEMKEIESLVDMVIEKGGFDDTGRNRSVVAGWLEAVPEDGREAFAEGLMEVAREAPEEKFVEYVNAYPKIWNQKSSEAEMEGAARKITLAWGAGMLAFSFMVIALFSLILIALAIEKNTRKAT